MFMYTAVTSPTHVIIIIILIVIIIATAPPETFSKRARHTALISNFALDEKCRESEFSTTRKLSLKLRTTLDSGWV